MMSILPEVGKDEVLPKWASELRDKNQGWMHVAQDGVQAFVVQALANKVPRFIPTYGGNTSTRMPRLRAASVHPHVRGEHEALPPLASISFGSSPRTGRTLFPCQLSGFHIRFIPTYGGNTKNQNKAMNWLTVHPHVRGEHRFR